MTMLVKTACPICHCDTYIQVDAEEYARWQAGELIQVAMPGLDADEREMLISGICPECWARTFGQPRVFFVGRSALGRRQPFLALFIGLWDKKEENK